jgi:phosphoribosyl 1,2-cyclic phosphodiesterase
MSGAAAVNFWGVRGSTPCDGHQFSRYGGNTSCVEVQVPGHEPIVFDLGTGLRNYGEHLQQTNQVEATEPRCC